MDTTAANEQFLRQYAETYRFSLGRPSRAALTPDGSAVLFLRSAPRSFVMDLYEFNCATGQERVLLTADQILAGQTEQLSAEEKAQRERLRLATRGIARYDLSDDGQKILVPLSGRLFVVDRASGKSTEVKSKSSAYPLDASLSPDAKKIAAVKGGEIFITDLATEITNPPRKQGNPADTNPPRKQGNEHQITSGAGGAISNGTAEFVAQEEMDRHRGYWWSPDSQLIAYQQTDTAGVEIFHIADPAKPEIAPQSWPYPRTGTKNASVKLGIVPASGGATTWIDWDKAKYPYLATVKWDEGGPLTILVQNRLQTAEVLYRVDEKTGQLTELLTETDPAWINLDQACPHWLRDGSGFLWLTERTGEWQLELRSPTGKLLRTLTQSGFGLLSLIGVDQKRRLAYVTATADPTQMHVYTVPLDAGSPTRITTKPGNHMVTLSKDASAYVHSFSLADGASASQVCRSGGDILGTLTSKAEEPPFMPRPELLAVGDRNFHALILRPRTFDAAKKYPVIVYVYGGPHALTVNISPRQYLLQQWLADQGFIVVTLDGRGTPRRGRDWERSIKGNLIDIPLTDQIAGLQALGAKHKELDLQRVGITGWSFGGYFSAMATMRRPDIYKAGVAGAPVCDFRDYDTHYTERYMGLPDENKPGYEASSVLTYCQDLTVPLLIIHGTADDNVYFLHALKMTSGLFRAGKQFEFLPLAGYTHMVPDPEVTVRLNSRIATFFKQTLGEPK